MLGRQNKEGKGIHVRKIVDIKERRNDRKNKVTMVFHLRIESKKNAEDRGKTQNLRGQEERETRK